MASVGFTTILARGQRRLQWLGHARRETEGGVLKIVGGYGGFGKKATGKTEKSVEEDSAAGLAGVGSQGRDG